MTNQIKNFIEEGEKEFEEKFGKIIKNVNIKNLYTIEEFLPEEEKIKAFISSRQISLIKMIVDRINKQYRYEIGGYPEEGAYMERCDDGDFIKLKDLLDTLVH